MALAPKEVKQPADAFSKAAKTDADDARESARAPRMKKTTMTAKLAEEAKAIVGNSKLDLNAGRQLRTRAAQPPAKASTSAKRGREAKAKATGNAKKHDGGPAKKRGRPPAAKSAGETVKKAPAAKKQAGAAAKRGPKATAKASPVDSETAAVEETDIFDETDAASKDSGAESKDFTAAADEHTNESSKKQEAPFLLGHSTAATVSAESQPAAATAISSC